MEKSQNKNQQNHRKKGMTKLWTIQTTQKAHTHGFLTVSTACCWKPCYFRNLSKVLHTLHRLIHIFPEKKRVSLEKSGFICGKSWIFFPQPNQVEKKSEVSHQRLVIIYSYPLGDCQVYLTVFVREIQITKESPPWTTKKCMKSCKAMLTNALKIGKINIVWNNYSQSRSINH